MITAPDPVPHQHPAAVPMARASVPAPLAAAVQLAQNPAVHVQDRPPVPPEPPFAGTAELWMYLAVVGAALPEPAHVKVSTARRSITLTFDQAHAGAVDAWAAGLGLPTSTARRDEQLGQSIVESVGAVRGWRVALRRLDTDRNAAAVRR